MKITIIIGGKAGQGPNLLTDLISESLIKAGFYVFYSRDYESLIRGGHNFNTLTFSNSPVYSNESKADILICLDENTEKVHKNNMKKKTIILKDNSNNIFFAGSLCKLLNLDIRMVEDKIKHLRNYGENMRELKKGYNQEKRNLELTLIEKKEQIRILINGSQAIAKASIYSGLEFYYAYPMTPATPLMMELGQAQLNKDSRHKVIELENEIAVMITALGSSSTGSLSMVGTSGGGFDLMTEGLSMAGMAEIPIVIYLASRPGPGTGVATYTSQADLNLALYSGHGEFSRLVIAPGDPLEAEEATNQAFYFSQKYKIPAIILSDKHLGESKFVVENSPKILEIQKSITSPERFNSYESDKQKDSMATEDSNVIKRNFEKRAEKYEKLSKEIENFETFKVYGNESSKNIIMGWGSTKGAITDALAELKEKNKKSDFKFIQIIYLEPFSKYLEAELEKAKKIIVIENNATSPLAQLITQKTGIKISDENKILKYDGRPFFSDELAEQIFRRLK